MKRIIRKYLVFIFIYFVLTANSEAQYLKRSLDSAPEVKNELTSGTTHYRSLFGQGDENSGIIRGISRYGSLVIDPGGNSNQVRYENEEQVIFIIAGTGILRYGKVEIPVTKNDFMHIPGGLKFSISNPREQPLSLIMMGFKIKPEKCLSLSPGLRIANTDEVKFQTLPSHGPTTQFQLLMGTTESTRDRLAAACQVSSLFIMDFAAGGTNNPHRHDKEEEIYLVLRGNGDMVAGENESGDELRLPSKAGDVYFFSPKNLIGFYGGNKEEEEHARILAVRFNYYDNK